MITSWRGCALLTAIALTGCGDGDGPFEYMPVHGTIAYEDGQPVPAAGIMLQFESQDAKPVDGMHPRPAGATVDSKGAFTSATSLKYADGLIPGKHKVALQYATDKDGKLLVPKEYTHLGTTPLVIDTGDGVITIKVPRPLNLLRELSNGKPPSSTLVSELTAN